MYTIGIGEGWSGNVVVSGWSCKSYICDGRGICLRFKTLEDAKLYLYKKGFDDKDIKADGLVFIEEELIEDCVRKSEFRKLTELENLRPAPKMVRLIKENPYLPVIPFVAADVTADVDPWYWQGDIYDVRIQNVCGTEPKFSKWYCPYLDHSLVGRSPENEQKLIEAIAHQKYDGSDEAYRKAAEEAEQYWHKAIVIYIETPDVV